MTAPLPRGVVQVADGHYVTRWTDIDDVPRKRNFRRPRDGRTDAAVRKAAIAHKEDRAAAKRRGEADAPPTIGGPTVADLVAEWLDRGARPTTIARDRAVSRTWVLASDDKPGKRLGDRRVRQVRADHIEALVKEMVAADLKPSTVQSYYGRVSALFAFARQTKPPMRTDSPCVGIAGVPRAPDRKERPVLSWDDIHRLADALPEGYRPVAYLGALGLRRAEIFGLAVADLDFVRRRLSVRQTVTVVGGHIEVGPPKTKKSRRTIQVPAQLMAFLGDHLAEQDRQHSPEAYVLQAPSGGPVRPDLFRHRVWAPACTAAGLEGLGLHDLRHGAVALMREAGVPVEVASHRLGHSSIRTTIDIYGSLPQAIDEEAAGALDTAMERPAENRPIAFPVEG